MILSVDVVDLQTYQFPYISIVEIWTGSNACKCTLVTVQRRIASRQFPAIEGVWKAACLKVHD
jgi:hypothetical protein